VIRNFKTCCWQSRCSVKEDNLNAKSIADPQQEMCFGGGPGNCVSLRIMIAVVSSRTMHAMPATRGRGICCHRHRCTAPLADRLNGRRFAWTRQWDRGTAAGADVASRCSWCDNRPCEMPPLLPLLLMLAGAALAGLPPRRRRGAALTASVALPSWPRGAQSRQPRWPQLCETCRPRRQRHCYGCRPQRFSKVPSRQRQQQQQQRQRQTHRGRSRVPR